MLALMLKEIIKNSNISNTECNKTKENYNFYKTREKKSNYQE